MAVATVRAAGATPEVLHNILILLPEHLNLNHGNISKRLMEFVNSMLSAFQVRDGMRFMEVVLQEPDKTVVSLADAYFFPPFQPSLMARSKGGALIPTKLPPRRARLVVYNKKSNETSVWIVELSEVHAATRGGHHRGKVISSRVVVDVQPPMVILIYEFHI